MHHSEPSSAVRTPHRRRRFAALALHLGVLGGLTLSGCSAAADGLPAGPATAPASSTPADPVAPAPDASTAARAPSGPGGTPSSNPAGPASGGASPSRSTSSAVAPAVPTSVGIPAIGLDEPLIGLGLADDGSLLTPDDPDQVAWFDGGSRPGEPGPTVIVGHVDSRTGPAVFAQLTELGPGDVVEVSSADGTRTSYQVDEVRDVPQDTFPTEAVFGASPTDELRLITCTGPWDRAEGYRDNRVVFASAR